MKIIGKFRVRDLGKGEHAVRVPKDIAPGTELLLAREDDGSLRYFFSDVISENSSSEWLVFDGDVAVSFNSEDSAVAHKIRVEKTTGKVLNVVEVFRSKNRVVAR